MIESEVLHMAKKYKGFKGSGMRETKPPEYKRQRVTRDVFEKWLKWLRGEK